MPWNETVPMDHRERFLADYRRGLARRAASSAAFMSAQDAGRDGPLIIAARRAHPDWGPRLLLDWSRPRSPRVRDWPATSTAGAILKRDGPVVPRRRRRVSTHPGVVDPTARANARAQQPALNVFQAEPDDERPHARHGGTPPGAHYSTSPRPHPTKRPPLAYPASVLPELVEQAARDDQSPIASLDSLLSGQLARNDERRLSTMRKLSGLPPGKTLEDFDWGFQPKADRRQIESLATCHDLRETTHVLFLGPPGVRTSHLATALGAKANKNGFSVTHFVLDDLMHVIEADAATPPARLRARRDFSCSLLIIGEIGIRPLDRIEANLIFHVASTRYERGSMLLTSDKHIRDRPEIFAGDEILTTAIFDRWLHPVAVVHIDGPSYRLRECGALLSSNREGPDRWRVARPDPVAVGTCLRFRRGNAGVLAHFAP
jgi:DNA replication protein DnaC